MTVPYRGRLGLQQRVLPEYRVPFFDLLAAACSGGLSVFAGQPRPEEGILSGALQVSRQARARNIHLFSGSAYLCLQSGVIDWLSTWDPSALIVEANPRYLSTAAAVRWMHARGRPVIGWGLGAPAITGWFGAIRRERRRRFLEQFDGVIAYSRRGADEYAQAGVSPDRIFVADNAVAPRPSHKPVRGPILAEPTILFVGRLQRRKHIDSLLRACAEMRSPRPRLLIVGDGPDRSRLESLASQIYPAVEFAGARHGSELEAYYQRADLFVLPGTGGLAVQQAMAHALPIIVARGDGTQDDLVRQTNGWQIAADDHDALVSALMTALSDQDKLRLMGDESFRIVSEEINLEKMVDGFLDALASVRPTGDHAPQAAPEIGGRS